MRPEASKQQRGSEAGQQALLREIILGAPNEPEQRMKMTLCDATQRLHDFDMSTRFGPFMSMSRSETLQVSTSPKIHLSSAQVARLLA
jgi:hypothetical protein